MIIGCFADVYAPDVIAPTVLLAKNAAVTNAGLIDVAGGGWEHYNCESFPCAVTGWVAGMFQLERVERGVPQVVTVSITNREGEDLGFGAELLISATARLVPFAVQFNFVAKEVCTAIVHLAVGDVDMAAPEFEIQSPPEPIEDKREAT